MPKDRYQQISKMRDDLRAVHLTQEHRMRADARRQATPVLGHHRRLVTDSDADVHRCVRPRADAASARRHERADTGDAPVGREPAGVAGHAASGQADGCVEANAGSAIAVVDVWPRAT